MWAWGQESIGMEIAGTIHNEVRIDGQLELPPAERPATDMRNSVAQHEPSGGGRTTHNTDGSTRGRREPTLVAEPNNAPRALFAEAKSAEAATRSRRSAR